MKRQTKNGEKKRIFLQTKIIRYSKKVVPFLYFYLQVKKNIYIFASLFNN